MPRTGKLWIALSPLKQPRNPLRLRSDSFIRIRSQPLVPPWCPTFRVSSQSRPITLCSTFNSMGQTTVPHQSG